MQKLFFGILALSLFGGFLFAWTFTRERMNIARNDISVYPSPKKDETARNTYPVGANITLLKEKQSSQALKDIIDELGNNTYSISGRDITLRDGTFVDKTRKETFTLSNVYFAATDTNGKAGALVILVEEKDENLPVYSVVIRTGSGKLTNTAPIGNDLQIQTATIRDGVILIDYKTGSGEEKQTLFVLTKTKDTDIPTIEEAPKTLVIKD